MASPVDANRLVTNTQPGVRPWTVNLPTGIVAGDLLIAFGRGGGLITTLLPTGWSWLVQNDSTDASDDTVSIIYRWADGSEGATLSWDMGFAIKGSCIVWRITGAANPATRTPEVASSLFTTVINTADPPAITPTGGSKDYLFLALMAKDGITVVTAAPSGYSNLTIGTSAGSGAATTNCTVAGASKQATAATENPGVFTHPAASTGGNAYVIAIHPPASTGVTLFGVTATSFTFTKAVQAIRKTFGVTATPISFVKDVQAVRKTFGVTASVYTFTKAVQATRKTFGIVDRSTTLGAVTQGARQRLGASATTMTLGAVTQARRQTFGVVARPTIVTITTVSTDSTLHLVPISTVTFGTWRTEVGGTNLQVSVDEPVASDSDYIHTVA